MIAPKPHDLDNVMSMAADDYADVEKGRPEQVANVKSEAILGPAGVTHHQHLFLTSFPSLRHVPEGPSFSALSPEPAAVSRMIDPRIVNCGAAYAFIGTPSRCLRTPSSIMANHLLKFSLNNYM
jgi:hypothetical protein